MFSAARLLLRAHVERVALDDARPLRWLTQLAVWVSEGNSGMNFDDAVAEISDVLERLRAQHGDAAIMTGSHAKRMAHFLEQVAQHAARGPPQSRPRDQKRRRRQPAVPPPPPPSPPPLAEADLLMAADAVPAAAALLQPPQARRRVKRSRKATEAALAAVALQDVEPFEEEGIGDGENIPLPPPPPASPQWSLASWDLHGDRKGAPSFASSSAATAQSSLASFFLGGGVQSASAAAATNAAAMAGIALAPLNPGPASASPKPNAEERPRLAEELAELVERAPALAATRAGAEEVARALDVQAREAAAAAATARDADVSSQRAVLALRSRIEEIDAMEDVEQSARAAAEAVRLAMQARARLDAAREGRRDTTVPTTGGQ